MLWWLPMALGAGAGLLGNAQKRRQYEDDLKYQSKVAEFSPWTGMAAQRPSAPTSALNDLISGGLSGFALGKQVEGAIPGGSAESSAGTPDMPPSREGLSNFDTINESASPRLGALQRMGQYMIPPVSEEIMPTLAAQAAPLASAKPKPKQVNRPKASPGIYSKMRTGGSSISSPIYTGSGRFNSVTGKWE